MAETLIRPMADHEQRQAVGYLQEVMLGSKKERGNGEPGMLEMQIYYLLSDLDALPESYTADWPTELMR
ncbi:MAG TPA: hypothetical protein VGQ59_15310 [Cyclobacteriaceae bacterium]|jgi:hypothetical protein|nr:hypothetical protein [Cyclobacteriaceae bacterium]